MPSFTKQYPLVKDGIICACATTYVCKSLADDAVSIDGTDYLPVGKPNSYKDYELIYYINDVTIDLNKPER